MEEDIMAEEAAERAFIETTARAAAKEFLAANVERSENRTINENPDSLELGTPSKLGAIKVYGNFDNPEGFKKKIDNAAEVRSYANSKIGNA